MNTWFTRISEIKVNGQFNDKSSCKIPNSKDKGLTFRENSTKLQLMNSIALGHVGDEKPVNAIDNNNTTKWANFASSWIQTELQNKSKICSVEITWNYKQKDNNVMPLSSQYWFLIILIVVNSYQRKLDSGNRDQDNLWSHINALEGKYTLTHPVIAKYIKINVTKINGKIDDTPKQIHTSGRGPLVIGSSESGGITQLDRGLPSPVGITFNNNTDKIYVSSKRFNWVVPMYETNGNMSISRSILVGDTPIALDVDAKKNKIYVANWGSNSISIINK